MTRAQKSQILATLLGALSTLGPGTLSMCGSGMEINGMKVSPTGVRIDAVNIGTGSGQQGMDPAAGQRGRTEYEGTVQHRCLQNDPEVCW